MDYTIVEAAALRPYSVYLKFNDGVEGVVDMDSVVGSGGVFDPLSDMYYFAKMRLDPELGTIAWPNGADICPDKLHQTIKNAGNSVANLH